MIRKFLALLVCLFSGCNNETDQTRTEKAETDDWVSELVWIQAANEKNPFDQDILDCRAVALGFTATTSDKNIAESFNRLRLDDGKSYIGQLPENCISIDADLRFPFNGKHEDGVIFCAKQMEDKWDFFVYEKQMYIRRSWTGALVHVLNLRFAENEVIVERIHSNADTVFGDLLFSVAHVNFLIHSHMGEQLLPFPIAPCMPKEERKTIALMGFSSYGRRAQFGTYLEKYSEQ